MRCIANILNLVVQDRLKMANLSVKKLRENIRWVRGSPARLFKFKELATLLGVEETYSLCLDVPTRWNSTYMMIRNAIPYRSVFESYDGQDASFKMDLGDSMLAEYDWVELLTTFEELLEMMLRIFGSLYVTSNCYLTEICDLWFSLTEMMRSQNFVEKNMGQKMKEKFDKYWGDPQKMNFLIFFANILDPRDKIEYMEDQFTQLFGETTGETCFLKLKSRLASLFEDYVTQFSEPSQSQTESQSQSQSQSGKGLPPLALGRSQSKFKSLLKKQKLESGALEGKRRELDVYLGEAIVDDNGKDFDLLMWWKLNNARFPILSRLA
ncbi:LOW QUALITY PROTEIN: hypothetical protein OSB04_011997 [Centaurea solstitialis]|uniref:Transposase n=1 Tax=Centaurea solstitialis TaxID=347529 RepID=A0AA38TAK1_9ASTR|nr:LOW QUALITY PROTEIN: hypothetical protein OSB04_011997 [Centaurea solstitialis]